MNSRIFHIDYKKLVQLLLPIRLRRPLILLVLQSLIWPLQMLYGRFTRQRDAHLYRLKITPQVVYLERLLNDKYDILERRIRIVDPQYFDPMYLYQKEENKPVYLHQENENQPVYLYQSGQTPEHAADFTIEIPADITFLEPELRAVVDAYKLAGKIYMIKIV